MSVTAVAAIASFVVLFGAWVILPSLLKRRHSEKIEADKE